MLKYLSSFFWPSNDEELSLQESCNILQKDDDSEEPTESANFLNYECEIEDHEENSFSTNTGIITEQKGDTYIIDSQFEFESDRSFNIGCMVSYRKFFANNKFNIYDVKEIDPEWDNTELNKKSFWINRILVRQVAERKGRIFTLKPGDISLDLDKTATEFVPLVGDWLEVEVKCVTDETALDLCGEIIEINQISPVRRHIENGSVTFWDSVEKSGNINRKIYFNQSSLSQGYIPAVGDKIISEIIESEQNRYTWRALKVIPEFITKRSDVALGAKVIEETHPDLVVSERNLSFTKLNESQQFKINISTNAEKDFVLVNAQFAKSNSQCKILEEIKEKVIITKEKSYDVCCECIVKNMGTSSEYLLLHFEDFSLGSWIKINLTTPNGYSNSFYQKKHHTNFRQSQGQLIKGERLQAPVRFRKVQLPPYNVPNKLYDVVTLYSQSEQFLLIEQLRISKPSIVSDLTHINYEDKFHSLLYLDEVANLIAIKNYDQDRVCFIENHEYLMLEIENLAERRPSIVLGDKIIASDPLGVSTEEYEGWIHKVGAKHVYLRFNPLFHDRYRGEDYSIRVVPGRAMYRRLHHAINLVVRNLGPQILFPNRISEKEVQTNFTYDPYPNTVNTNAPSPPKKSFSPRDALKKMKEHNAAKSNIKEKHNTHLPESNVLKLEWYNKKLNCKQKDAVINILKGVARPLPYVIFGPPGTGKTVTVIETILQIVRHIPSSRLLVTAPSNSAADLISLRLINSGVLKPGDLVRLVSMNYALGDNIPPKLVPYCATSSSAREGTAEENILKHDGITYDCSMEVLGRHRIVVSTCASAGQLYQVGFPNGHFTHIIVDEAGQAMEPEVMIPIAFFDKYNGQVILAGDPMQLGPVVLSKVAEECGLQESFLERLTSRFPYVRDLEGFPNSEGYDPRIVTKLLYNYRSLSPILELFSSIFYNGDLIATISSTDSTEASLLQSLSSMLPTTLKGGVPSIVFHGVLGENYQTTDSPSWYNPHEASQVFFYVNEFYRLGLKADNIGIITPYIKQVKEIKQILREAEFDLPRVGTVEEFQGQEFDVILMSTVRSSSDYVTNDIQHSLGFVSSPRRLNVAISRPKSLLVIIGNPNFLCHDTYWRTIIKYCLENGAYTGCDLDA